MSAIEQFRSGRDEASVGEQKSTESSSGLAFEGKAGHVYNEEAFRYFLDIEGKRSERSNRPFLLLLADLKEQPGMTARMEPEVATSVFSALRLGLRDTDFVGWYREEWVAGAVLTERADSTGDDVFSDVRERVAQVVNDRLPRAVAGRIQVRVYQQTPTPTSKGRSA